MKRKKIRRIVDNKMRSYGDTDLERKVIRINKSKKKNKRGDIIDTILHEELHAKHPRMHENTIKKMVKKKLTTISEKQKQKLYNRYK